MESPDYRAKAAPAPPTGATAAAKALDNQGSPVPNNDYGQNLLLQNNRVAGSRRRAAGDVLMGGTTGTAYPLTERKNQDGIGQNGCGDLVGGRRVKF